MRFCSSCLRRQVRVRASVQRHFSAASSTTGSNSKTTEWSSSHSHHLRKTSASNSPRKNHGNKNGDAIGLALFSGVSVLGLCLGQWQTDRYNGKVNLLADRRQGLQGPPRDVSDLNTIHAQQQDDFLKVRLAQGQWDYTNEVLLGPRQPPKTNLKDEFQAVGKSGFYVLTPFRCSNGQSVVVNRGWVPRNGVKQPEVGLSATSLVGVVRRPERQPKFTSNPNQNDVFVWLDLDALAKRFGAQQQFLIDLIGDSESDALPKRRSSESYLTDTVMPSTHATYAATWYSLACFALVCGGLRFGRPVMRRFRNQKL